VTSKAKTGLILGGIGVVVCVGLVRVLPDLLVQVRDYRMEGRITAIDYGTREASVEFRHPRSGYLQEVTRPVPTDCPITVQGTPAGLEVIKVGDRVNVRGEWDRRTKRVRILAIDVVPAGAVETAPATEVPPSAE
jgi:hypothetical protein